MGQKTILKEQFDKYIGEKREEVTKVREISKII